MSIDWVALLEGQTMTLDEIKRLRALKAKDDGIAFDLEVLKVADQLLDAAERLEQAERDHAAVLDSVKAAHVKELEGVLYWKHKLETALAALTKERDAATVQTKYCDMIACNPQCLRCGDTPSCGDGSWGWMDGVHRHRCRDSHPQCGHDRVPCEKHQPQELIAMLLDEVKALRIVRDVKNAEVDRLTAERDAQAEAVRVLGRLAYCQAKREKLLNMDPTSTHPEVAEEQVANGIALIRVMGEVGANPIARAAVEEEKA